MFGGGVGAVGAGISGVMNIVGANKQIGEYRAANRQLDKKVKTGLDALLNYTDLARRELDDYANVGPEALAYIRSALYGGEQEYEDPAFRALTKQEVQRMNDEAANDQRARYLNERGKLTAEQADFLRAQIGLNRDPKMTGGMSTGTKLLLGGGDLIGGSLLGGLFGGDKKKKKYAKIPKEYQDEFLKQVLAQEAKPVTMYDLGKTWYKGPDGSISLEAPKRKVKFDPTQSEAYKIQKERGLGELDRLLRLKGRSNSSYGFDQNAEFLQNLNMAETDKQLDRLGQLLTVGQTGSGNLANLSNNIGNNIATLYQNWGTKKAQGLQALGDVKAAKWEQMAKDNKAVFDNLGSMVGGGGGGGGMGGGGMSFLSGFGG